MNERLNLQWLRDPETQEIINETIEVDKAVATSLNVGSNLRDVAHMVGLLCFPSLHVLHELTLIITRFSLSYISPNSKGTKNEIGQRGGGRGFSILSSKIPLGLRAVSAPGKSQNRLLKLRQRQYPNPNSRVFKHLVFPLEGTRAKSTPLPKTPNGLSDLNDTRPIALMESILKVYEHIVMVGRLPPSTPTTY